MQLTSQTGSLRDAASARLGRARFSEATSVVTCVAPFDQSMTHSTGRRSLHCHTGLDNRGLQIEIGTNGCEITLLQSTCTQGGGGVKTGDGKTENRGRLDLFDSIVELTVRRSATHEGVVHLY